MVRVRPAPGVKINESTRFYDITGRSGPELRRALNRNRPRDAKGVPHDATTSYYVRWSYPFDRGRSSCGLGKVTVQLDVKYTLPRWRPPADSSASLTREWKRYSAALFEHEYQHRDFGVRASNEIHETLSVFRPRARCPTADKAANAAANQILARYLQQERDYDRRTHHGASQGAQFF